MIGSRLPINRLFDRLSIGLFIALAAILIFPQGFPALAAAPRSQSENVTASFTLADLGEADIVARQVYEQVEVHFPLAEGQDFQQALLNLHLEHSPDLLPEYSDLTMALNGEPVASLILDSSNIESAFSPIQMPADALKPGENTLLFRFNLRLAGKGCGDAGSSKLWARVYADTSFELVQADRLILPDLGRYPAPFDSLNTLDGSPRLVFILPDQPVGAELTAAGRIAAALGQAVGWKEPPILSTTASQSSALPIADYHLIVINTGRRNPLADFAPRGLSERTSPYNPNRLMLTVSGSDDAELLQSADMLATRSMYTHLAGVDASPAAAAPVQALKKPAIQSFTDLGLQDWGVRGIGAHDLYFPIYIPYDWKVTSEASIEVKFTHSRALSASSFMSVFINGKRISDIALTNYNAADGRLTVKLSPRQIHQGRNWLHLNINLHLANEDCRYRYLEEVWLDISSDSSTINLAHVESQPPADLRYMPALWIIPSDLGDDIFVLPDHPTSDELTAYVVLAAKLGTYVDADGLRPLAMSAREFSQQLTAFSSTTHLYHFVLVGSPSTNSVLANVDEKLPQPLKLTDGAIVQDIGREMLQEEMAISVGSLPTAGYLQLLPAPWSSYSEVLVVASYDPGGLQRAVAAFPSAYEHFNIQGNVAVVTSDQLMGLSLGGLINYPLSITARVAVAGVLVAALVLIGAIAWITNRNKRLVEQSPEVLPDEEL